MGPINRYSLSSIYACIYMTAPITMRGEKLDGDSRMDQLVCWDVSGSPLSQEQ
jgi:hypothetical protein